MNAHVWTCIEHDENKCPKSPRWFSQNGENEIYLIILRSINLLHSEMCENFIQQTKNGMKEPEITKRIYDVELLYDILKFTIWALSDA